MSVYLFTSLRFVHEVHFGIMIWKMFHVGMITVHILPCRSVHITQINTKSSSKDHHQFYRSLKNLTDISCQCILFMVNKHKRR
jgi:hypothetical protein